MDVSIKVGNDYMLILNPMAIFLEMFPLLIYINNY